jgi:6-phosphogluconolactonase
MTTDRTPDSRPGFCGARAPDVCVADRSTLVDRLVHDFEVEAEQALRERERFAVALPGGSVAVNCFEALARVPLDWHTVQFFWIDERAVPATDPESNFRLAQSLWFEVAGVPPGNTHRMPADDPELARAASSYEAELIRSLGQPVRLDFVLLGVGPDGHVASLFPGHPAGLDEQHLVTGVWDAPKPPPRRLTLTMPVLTAARRVAVVAFGTSKAEALSQGVDQPNSHTPLAVLLRRSARALVLADNEAGGLLPATGT